MNEEAALLAGCIRGQKDAWDEFVDRYSSLIYHQIHRCLGAHTAHAMREDVEDLYHSVFEALLERDRRRLRQFKGRCSLASWVVLITRRIVIDTLRKRRATVPLDAEDHDGIALHERMPDTKPNAEEETLDSERVEQLKDALQRLTPEDRLLANLVYQRDASPDEIAKVLNISKGAVYTRKTRLHEKLRELLEEI